MKELSSLPMLKGEIVDIVISAALQRVAWGEALPKNMATVGAKTFMEFVAASPAIVAQMHRRARTTQARQQSPHRALQSDYYDHDLGKEYEEMLADQVGTCLEIFQQSEVLEQILAIDPKYWGPFTRSLRTKPFFEIDGVRVYACFDFYLKDGRNLYILDWKTGFGSLRQREAAEQQLKVYALYGARVLGIPKDQIYVQAVWLLDSADWEPQAVSSASLRLTEERIKAEVAAETARLTVFESDLLQNEYWADRADFPAKPSARGCTNCKYRDICEEGQRACDHIIRRSQVCAI